MQQVRRPIHIRTIKGAHRGQTLIVALAILFIMLFLGAIFVARIAANLTASGRAVDTQSAQSFSEAGIRYCNDRLNSSEDGADWRPAPTPPITSTVDTLGVTDPDYQWLSQGFSRAFFTGGRALIRVSYDPHTDDSRSQFLELESVGRTGDLDQGLDPTVFVQTGNAPRLRREQIAYKQLGLTDYLFFITNKDNRSTENFLGTPSLSNVPTGVTPTANGGFVDLATVLGDPTIANFLTGATPGINNNSILFGAPIRSNGTLRIGGYTFIYESPRGTQPYSSAEQILCSQDINLASTNDVNGDGTITDADLQVYVNSSITAPNAANTVVPSYSSLFNTMNGLVRDGRTTPDVNGFNRSVPRLDPMRIDTTVNGSSVLRYRALTRDSGIQSGTQNTGFYGWGTGIYIDNPTDLQLETNMSGTNGGYSLRSDWLNPHAGFANGFWQGPFYRPPGVLVALGADSITFTRSDNDFFRKPDGTPITGAGTEGGKVLTIPLADDARANYHFPDGVAFPLPPLPHDGDDPTTRPTTGAYASASQPHDPNSYGVSLVMMAEGNVRVKGPYGAITPNDGTVHLGRVHLTIVSGGTAYIEGNIVKNDGYVATTGPVLERGSTCAIMAKDYVCVNTTMFMSPENQIGAWSNTQPGIDAFDLALGTNVQTYDASFSWGVPPNTYVVGGAATPIYLMMIQRALDPGPSAMNLLINPVLDTGAGNSLFQFNQAALPPETYPLGQRYAAGTPPTPFRDPQQISPFADRRAFLLASPGNPSPFYGASGLFNTLFGQPGIENILRFQKDQTMQDALGVGGSTDYLLGGAMVAPLDIRIEAAMYAQEKSFFIIPGYSFNSDPNDSRAAVAARGGVRTSYSVSPNGQSLDSAQDIYVKDLFPYYNEPMDVRITIFGSIAENYSASMGDQAMWLSRWGYIPTVYGSTANDPNPQIVPDDHLMVHDASIPAVTYNPGEDRTQDFRMPLEKNENITRGLRYIYDPAFAMPYMAPADVALNANPNVRVGRALRFNYIKATAANHLPQDVYQLLPPIPKLPVCPGLLYFGDSQSPIVP